MSIQTHNTENNSTALVDLLRNDQVHLFQQLDQKRAEYSVQRSVNSRTIRANGEETERRLLDQIARLLRLSDAVAFLLDQLTEGKAKDKVVLVGQAAIELWSKGNWNGRASAVEIARKLNIPSTFEVLKIAEAAIGRLENAA